MAAFRLSAALVLACCAGCGQAADPVRVGAAPPEEAPTNASPAAPATPAPSAAPAALPGPLRGFKTPESVLWDPTADVYLVSNIDGSPLAKDDTGFISRVTPDGEVTLRWIDGAKPEVELDAPKGMAIVGDTLWVADLTVVRTFDRTTGAPRGKAIALEGATFLNDVVADGAGGVYVSDSGFKPGPEGFAPSGTDAIWHIDAGNVAKKIASGEALGRPNGLAMDAQRLFVVTFGTGAFYRLADGAPADVLDPKAGSLDGLVRLDDGSFLASSWERKAVLRGPAAGPWVPVAENLESPADIGFDGKRRRLLVPLFQLDEVRILALP
jgi:sugar lactone lactonase YvrE